MFVPMSTLPPMLIMVVIVIVLIMIVVFVMICRRWFAHGIVLSQLLFSLVLYSLIESKAYRARATAHLQLFG